ncbi:MAG: TRAP transporter substrate-binding protein DctP [Chloroflexota bacterium]
MRKVLLGFALLVSLAGVLAGCGGSDEPKEVMTLRVLSAWDQNNTSVKSMLNIYKPAIEEATDGRVTLEYVAGPETVPIFEQVEPLKQGIFDMVLQTDGYNQINALAAALNLNLAPYSVAKECGVVDFIDNRYQTLGGVKYFPQIHGFGNVLLLRSDVNVSDLTRLDGLTLRTYPTVDAWVKNRGAEPVAMSGGDAYTALDRGVVDGAIGGSIDFAENLSWNEVTEYIVMPELGATVANFLINIDVWNSMGADLQKKFEEGFAKASAEHFTYSAEQQKESLERMKAEGLQVVELTAAQKKAWADAWFEATSQSTVISRDAVEGPKVVELAACVKQKLESGS